MRLTGVTEWRIIGYKCVREDNSLYNTGTVKAPGRRAQRRETFSWHHRPLPLSPSPASAHARAPASHWLSLVGGRLSQHVPVIDRLFILERCVRCQRVSNGSQLLRLRKEVIKRDSSVFAFYFYFFLIFSDPVMS